MKGKIAITPRSLSRGGHPALQPLVEAGYELIFPAPGAQPTVAQLKASLPACVGYLAGVEPIPAEVLVECPQLKVISRNGTGIDNIDLDAAQTRGITVERAAGANARGVAELTITLLLAGLRDVPWSDKRLKEGQWARRQGIEVQGRLLGVIGCGQIGKYVTQMALGLGMRVWAYDLFPDSSFTPAGDFGFVTLDYLLAESEVVSLHCPPTEQPLIDVPALARMKEGVFLINTARASLIDEKAVLDALETGKLRGFATDVYHAEPPELNPLLCHDRVITTPHAGGFTEESIKRATEVAVSNLLKGLGMI